MLTRRSRFDAPHLHVDGMVRESKIEAPLFSCGQVRSSRRFRHRSSFPAKWSVTMASGLGHELFRGPAISALSERRGRGRRGGRAKTR